MLKDFLALENLARFGIGDFAYTEILTPLTFDAYKAWVTHGHHTPLKYLADDRQSIRQNLNLFFPEAESAFVFLFPYEKKQNSNKLASFITGFDDRDYHLVIEERLHEIGENLKKIDDNLNYKISIDKHPVLERDLAYRAGLGWFGKSSLLIHPKLGTFFLIGSLLLSKKIDWPIRPIHQEWCGQCQRCLDSCPTKAIIHPKVVEAQKCISCFTIELFKESPAPQGYEEQSYILGCDRCQEVCPWNKNHILENNTKSSLELFFERPYIEILSDLEKMSKKDFVQYFKGTSLERLGKNGLLKNLRPEMLK